MNKENQMKCQIFYPENDMLMSPLVFNTVAKACEHMESKKWEAIKPMGLNDLKAYMNNFTGSIVVIRKVEELNEQVP